MSSRTTKRNLWTVVVLTILLLGLVLLPPQRVYSQVGTEALQACAKMAFSTEEDFITQGPEPPDGNPIISDGDLLSPDGAVCARNHDLLQVFKVTRDLGLDAVDVLSVEKYLVAFSTELDHPGGGFTAGDLLATNGAVIPNVALTHRFEIGYDIGLDAVHFVGDLDSIVAFLDEVKGLSRDYWLENPGALAGMLKQYGLDIWFSTEGTAPSVERPQFLDGDLLSAANGVIILPNSVALPVSVPAGIPDRGVDFGLDAFASHARDVEKARERGLFSTSILYWPADGALNFTDGDVLAVGDGVTYTNYDLIKAFEPRADELGLDALYIVTYRPPGECEPALAALGGSQAPIANLNPADGTVTLFWPTRHPFGNDVPFWGHIPTCVDKFRVVQRPDGNLGDGTPILPGTWAVGDIATWNGSSCVSTMPRPPADAQGYFDGPEYRDDLLPCDPSLPLTNWDTSIAADPDGLYEVRLDWIVGGTTFHGPWHKVQLDNTLPKINDMNLVVQAGSAGGTADCPIYTPANMPLMLQGDFADDYFWRYQARIDGDLLPGYPYTLTNYYDGTLPAAHLDDTGTTPDGSLQDLHPVSVYDLTSVPPDCCYSVRLRVWDRTVWGHFWGFRAVVTAQFGRWVSDDIYFAFQP